jgi:acyl carrier protein
VKQDKWGEQVLRERVREVVAAVAPIQAGPVNSSSRFVDDLGYDSLGLVELLIMLEQELGLPEIDERVGVGIESVADLEDLVVAAILPPAKSVSP